MAQARFDPPLPIDAVLGALTAALARKNSAVLVAPPGAGKTTRVPLVLLGEAWMAGRRLLLLEPRRLAARAAAARMAATLGEEVGRTVGLRVRMETRVSAATRIEVVTEGVFSRTLLDDPMLAGVGAVLFDEFHERSLESDLGLALAIDAQQGLREDLRLLVMSATLDGARVARLLGAAPVVESEGRGFPIETRYIGRDPALRIEQAVSRAVLAALADEPGSLLVFLPGQREILAVAAELRERIGNPAIDIAPLYGAMDKAAQDLAVAPALPGRRKIVLATSIAETSLTIEGIRVVVDSGLARVPRYEPDIGLTRLETVRVSRAGADQRRGRAGRTAPGLCIRLWEEAANGALPPFTPPEILGADLSGLLLDLALWGVRDPRTLAWLDPPPRAALAEARALLTAIGAIDDEGGPTDTGRAMRAMALPPRLARMVIGAAAFGEAGLAAEIALLLVERGLGGDAVDLAERHERFRADRLPRARDARVLARRFAAVAEQAASATESGVGPVGVGALVALAYPDRIGKARGKTGEFLMANGRACQLEPAYPLAREPFLAIAEISGRAAAARIVAAASLSLEAIESSAALPLETRVDVSFDAATASLRARRQRRLGALVLSEQPLPAPADAAAVLLAQGIAALGLDRLPWNKTLAQWRDRVLFLRRAEGEAAGWPDLSEAALVAGATDWLAPFLVGKSRLDDIGSGDLDAALKALLPFALARRLEAEAPTHFEAPTGSRIAIDYESEGAPIVAIRVQEMFGLGEHPSLAGGRVPLTLHLLSPAHQPLQITRDLPGFWRGSWAAVRSDMRGRYPRHAWPEEPAKALPTARAKPRGR